MKIDYAQYWTKHSVFNNECRQMKKASLKKRPTHDFLLSKSGKSIR